MTRSKVLSVKEQYDEWIRLNPLKTLTKIQQEQLDNKMREEIISELEVTGKMDISEYMLLHKWKEVNEFVRKYNMDEIKEVENLIWKPQGRSDFRRVHPELVLTSNTIEIKKKNFWGEESFEEYVQDDRLIRHWNILRVLISSSRHDGVIGRQLRYLIRDKITKKYLGIICIASSMMNLSERNKEVFGGDITQNEQAKFNFVRAFGKGGRSVNMANGQTIMCTQPFGRNFNGGKFLALMCLSKQVCDDWETRYGDKLVTVETTSLYGEKNSTQYDGLRPYWRNLGKTSGDTPIKPTDDLWKSIRRWLKKRYPDIYFHFIIELNQKNQPAVRDKKNGLISKVYGLLGLNSSQDTSSGHQRGVFLSRLYTNSDDYLQYKINEEELIPSFDNSVETLTEFWKFGFVGDTKRDGVNPEIESKFQNKFKFEKKSSAKQRLQNMIERGDDFINLTTDWYLPMSYLSWEETREKFGDYVSR